MQTALTPEFKRLATKYPYIVAWGQLMGSFGYYILRQMQKAEAAKAPADAIFEGHDGRWNIYSECREELKNELDHYINGTKGGAIIN